MQGHSSHSFSNHSQKIKHIRVSRKLQVKKLSLLFLFLRDLSLCLFVGPVFFDSLPKILCPLILHMSYNGGLSFCSVTLGLLVKFLLCGLIQHPNRNNLINF